MSQLALPLQLADHAVFASYHACGNESPVAALSSIASGDSEQDCWLWGASSTGKTHLLQAVCEKAGDRAIYLPMSMLKDAAPGVLDGMANRDIVCMDDLDAVLGDADWEAALFDLYNQLFDSGGRIIASAAMAPREAGTGLPDLGSRLSQLAVFRLRSLDEEGTIAALQLRSTHRGLELPDDTAQFLLKRSRRDMASLYELLDRLDAAALQAKRRLTVPFVREVLAQD